MQGSIVCDMMKMKERRPRGEDVCGLIASPGAQAFHI